MRTEHRGGRPLLKDKDVSSTLKSLMEVRNPIYETADIVINATGDTPDDTAETIIKALEKYFNQSNS
jgi:shikimate kinase